MSKSCFATSKQLFEHSKGDHEGEPLGDKPFRCGLSGCGKSWKVSQLFVSAGSFYEEWIL